MSIVQLAELKSFRAIVGGMIDMNKLPFCDINLVKAITKSGQFAIDKINITARINNCQTREELRLELNELARIANEGGD